MDISKQSYAKLTDKKSPKSSIAKDTLLAFLIGGGICLIGQIIYELFLLIPLLIESAATATSIVLIFLGAAATGLGIYKKLAKFSGGGTLIPITGFANAIVSAAIEFKSEGLILGMSAKMFAIAGPVLVFGISASVIYGLILLILRAF